MIFLIMILFLFIKGNSQICTSSQLPLNLQNNLIAFFPFCGNYKDAGPNSFNGTANGAVPFIADRFNQPANAIQLGSGYVTAPTGVFTFQRHEKFSLSLWFIKSDNNNGGRLLSTECPEGNFRMAALGGGNYGVQYGDYISDNVPLGNWTHLVYTYDNRNEKVYINGVLKYTNYDASNEKLTYCAPFTIGAKASPAFDKWPGSFDDLLVYNRVLSECEVSQLYNATKTNIPELTGMNIQLFPDTIAMCSNKAMLDAGAGYESYSWNTGQTTKTIVPEKNGIYIATVKNGSCISTDSVYVIIQENKNKINLNDTLKVCGNSENIDAGPGFTSYNWNTGETGQIIRVNTSGLYQVTASNGICSDSDSIFVSIVNVKIQQSDTTICRGATILLNAASNSTSSTNVYCNYNELPANFQNGIIAFYSFCGNTNDISNNGNSGTAQNIGFLPDRFGTPNSAGKFTKTNSSFYYVPANKSMQPQSFTLSTWFNTNIIQTGGLESGQDQFIAGSSPKNWINGPSYTHYLTVDHNSILASMLWTSQTSWQNIKTPIFTIQAHKWYHAVTTYDHTTGLHKFYLNGELVGQRNSKIEYLNQSGFYIGGSRQNSAGIPDTFFDGIIDDVGLWNRPFSEDEVKQLFNSDNNILWSNGSTSSSILINPTTSTTISVRNSNGSSTCEDSIRVNVEKLDTSITLLDPVEVCNSNVNIRMIAGEANNYQWIKDGLAIPLATNKNYTATSIGNYMYINTSNKGCIDTSSNILVTQKAIPKADFTINKSEQCFIGNSFNFNNNSTISTGTLSFKWEFGEGTASMIPNPSKNFSDTGTFIVKLIVNSDNLCSDSISKSVTIWANPPLPLISGTNQFCQGSSTFLSTNATLGLQWYKNNLLLIGANNSTLTISTPGEYKIETKNIFGCSTFSNATTVSESPLPEGQIVSPTSSNLCEGQTLNLNANGGQNYQWYLNGSMITGANSGIYEARDAGTYSVDVINSLGCSKKATNYITLQLINKPKSDFNISSYCVNSPSNFSSNSNITNAGPISYSWFFPDGSISNGTSAIKNFQQPGIYAIGLVTTPLLCPMNADTIIKSINVQQAFPSIRYPTLNLVKNRNTLLSARNIGISYQWQPSINLSNASIRTPDITPKQIQEYLVSIVNASGCITTDTLLIRTFEDKNIYVAEGFTPNFDGKNDRLYPIAVGISNFHFIKIYNRWGNLVFQTNSLQPHDGWDGTYLGKTLSSDSFTWVAEGIDSDGNIFRKTGTSILIR